MNKSAHKPIDWLTVGSDEYLYSPRTSPLDERRHRGPSHGPPTSLFSHRLEDACKHSNDEVCQREIFGHLEIKPSTGRKRSPRTQDRMLRWQPKEEPPPKELEAAAGRSP